jgi:hypothetical protein
MKRVCAACAALVLAAPSLFAQNAAPRAWQQRIDVAIALPVPLVALETANPFAINVDTAPKLLSSSAPKKLDVAGRAAAAAYVNSKGECLGGVPLELPFPGLTTPLLDELVGSRFDPGTNAEGAVGSWVVLQINMAGRVKESTVGSPTFDLPDPAASPQPAAAARVAPSGLLLKAPYTPSDELTSVALPRRFKVKAKGREIELPIRALVHVTAEGRCDRFVPLNLDAGFNSWLSAFLSTWRLEPARRDGQPHEAWVIYSARAQLKLSDIESTGIEVLRDRSYEPTKSDD